MMSKFFVVVFAVLALVIVGIITVQVVHFIIGLWRRFLLVRKTQGLVLPRLRHYLMIAHPGGWSTCDEIHTEIRVDDEQALRLALRHMIHEESVESRLREYVKRDGLGMREIFFLEAQTLLVPSELDYHGDIPVYEFCWTGKSRRSRAKAPRKGLTLIEKLRARRELGVQ